MALTWWVWCSGFVLVLHSTSGLKDSQGNNINNGVSSALEMKGNHGSLFGEMLLPQSPECWKSVIEIFRETQDLEDETAITFCSMMPEDMQKLLALLIAQCHLQDLGKPLFQNPKISNDCIQQQVGNNRDNLQWCLKQLTDAGVTAYTHYVSYVQQLCIRLTQELLMTHQQKVQKDAAHRFSKISIQSIEQLEFISELAQRHSEALSDIPELLKEQLAEDLRNMLEIIVSQSLHEQLEQQLQTLITEQLEGRLSEFLRKQTMQQERLIELIESMDTHQKEHFESWTNSQTLLLQVHLEELERQREKMNEQNSEMDVLSQTLSHAMQIMQPILGLDSLVSAAMHGYTWVTFMLHLIVTFMIVWIVTRPQRCNSFRLYLFGIVVTEAIAEVAIATCAQYGLLSETKQFQKTMELRRLSLFLEGSFYIVGMFFSFVLPWKPQVTLKEKASGVQLEELQRRQETVLLQLQETLARSQGHSQTERHLQQQVASLPTTSSHSARAYTNSVPAPMVTPQFTETYYDDRNHRMTSVYERDLHREPASTFNQRDQIRPHQYGMQPQYPTWRESREQEASQSSEASWELQDQPGFGHRLAPQQFLYHAPVSQPQRTMMNISERIDTFHDALEECCDERIRKMASANVPRAVTVDASSSASHPTCRKADERYSRTSDGKRPHDVSQEGELEAKRPKCDGRPSVLPS